MLAILYQNHCKTIAEEVAADLTAAFNGHVHPEIVSAEVAGSPPDEQGWDDLLIVIYDGQAFPSSGNAFIEQYVQKRKHSFILPVALNPTERRPPKPAEVIKALEYDDSCKGVSGRLVNRVGGMLGLKVHRRDTQLFISYRATDGAPLAEQIEGHLRSIGYNPWRDEAKELDGETKILPGSPVQEEIDAALESTNLVLLLDTPGAPASPWIVHEVESAIANLVPVLPLCFRSQSESRIGPRFPSLVALQRWVAFKFSDKVSPLPLLTATELDLVVSEMENYICEIFRRKCRVPDLVEREFLSHGFDWSVLNKKLLMFQSMKGDWRVKTTVMSHCSIFDQIYVPSIARFGLFLKDAAPRNHSLFIYDGDMLTEPQLKQIVASHSEPVVILHHQEVAALIESNFLTLAAA